MKLFVGGSLSLTQLPEEVVEGLRGVARSNGSFLVGDAGGVDSQAQRLLRDWEVNAVHVYFSGASARFNLGNWPAIRIESGLKSKSAALHGAKDRAMVSAADQGIMVWDGTSVGTLANVLDLSSSGKPWVLWLVRRGELESIEELNALVDRFPELTQKAEKRLLQHRRRVARRSRQSNNGSTLF